MKSPEKVLAFLEEMQASSDADIADAIPLPLPAAMIRATLAGVAGQVPDDVDELDAWLTQLGEFCLSLRSDPADETAHAA
jgi:hypothetical protein